MGFRRDVAAERDCSDEFTAAIETLLERGFDDDEEPSENSNSKMSKGVSGVLSPGANMLVKSRFHAAFSTCAITQARHAIKALSGAMRLRTKPKSKRKVNNEIKESKDRNREPATLKARRLGRARSFDSSVRRT